MQREISIPEIMDPIIAIGCPTHEIGGAQIWLKGCYKQDRHWIGSFIVNVKSRTLEMMGSGTIPIDLFRPSVCPKKRCQD
jgi:hypothetical protein